MTRLFRGTLLLLTATVTAACGDDNDGPTGPSRAQVAGVYQICQLTFDPEGALASVNILDVGIETNNPEIRRPELRIDPGTAIQVAYTPRGSFVERTVGGTYDLSGSRATLRFPTEASRSALLLPAQLPLTFQATPRQLSTQASTAYTVPRARYAELTGQSEANLAPQIQGRLAATFRSGGCS